MIEYNEYLYNKDKRKHEKVYANNVVIPQILFVQSVKIENNIRSNPMAEYIDREKARDAVYARIDELKDDKEFNMAKEICISGVKKHIRAIPTADVIEREKIDKAIAEMKLEYYNLDSCENRLIASYWITKAINILKRNIGE